MDSKTGDIADENCVTFLDPHQSKKDGVATKWWHMNLKIFRFKLHFFLLGGGLSTVLPFVAVFAKNTLQLSATSFGAVMIFQQFFFVLTKPMIAYIADYFNKLKFVIFLLNVGQGIFLFLLLLIPPMPKEATDNKNSFIEDLADISTRTFCCSINATAKIEGKILHFNENIGSQCVYLSHDRECYFFKKDCKNYDKMKFPKLCQAVECSSYKISGYINSTNNNINETHMFFPSNQTDLETLVSNSNTSYARSISKYIICCNASNDCYLIFNFQEKVETPENTKNFKNDFSTLQFWLFAILFIGVNVCVNAIYTLSDTALYESVKKYGCEFGRQRLFSCIGWGLGAFVGGILTDFTGNYFVNFIIYAIMSILTLCNIYQLDFIKPDNSNAILKDIGTTVMSVEFICFEVGVLLMGIGLGFTWFYLIWFVTSIGGNRLVCGLVQTVQSFAGDVPFFFISGWMLKKIGYFNIMSLAFLACATRFLWYSQLHDPWLVLPMEWTHGMTYGLFYAAMASYAKRNAKPGTEATSQSVVFATFDGLGAGIGNIIAGIGFDSIGGRDMFLYTGIFFGCCSALSLLLTYHFRNRIKAADADDA